ncbi:GUN4 domain-containing protein [Microcoleus sp. FACHB-672]|uniref:GUN4 domain-containing protein n=1 Tax=Microcoleus sp. FACHB-672 TaxID=2692825 RepID=UPI001684723D|nr:GUN4 domain-containing protein [Microcoleus sp. FACHB-672]MBD2041804.1 GUN4 domain-containing protein [Microcoleus sp. FACHB-672]
MAKKSKSQSGDEPKQGSSKENKKHKRETLLRLEARLDEMQAQLQQAGEERAQLLSLLQQAAQERVYLQSQLEWVLYRLEQGNVGPTEEQSETYQYSEVGIDYSELQNLLESGKWQKADRQTWEVMLKAAGREKEGWLTVEDIQNFPCTDLRTIDWLWEHYSNGHFGLSVQQSIWQSSNTSYTDFCDCIGWRVRGGWLYYNELRFNLNATAGHLPVLAWRQRACYGVGKCTASESISHLSARLSTCNLP